jgi:hypothetical protein
MWKDNDSPIVLVDELTPTTGMTVSEFEKEHRSLNLSLTIRVHKKRSAVRIDQHKRAGRDERPKIISLFANHGSEKLSLTLWRSAPE